jgi:predicted aspartyl protease
MLPRVVTACLVLASFAVAASAADLPPAGAMQAAFAAGDFATAQSLADATLAASPNDIPANLMESTLALYRNDMRAAEGYASGVIAIDPKNAQALRNVTLAAGRREDADGTNIDMNGGYLRVPFVVTDPLPLVRVSVNNHPALFVIDTGAGNTVLDPAFAAEAGVTLTAAHGTADTFAIGDVTLHAVAIDAKATRGLPLFADRRADGIIGTRTLAHFLATIDYAHGALFLRPRSVQGSKDFERRTGASAVPMILAGDHALFVRGRINAGPEGWLALDTGRAPADAAVPATLTVGVRKVDAVRIPDPAGTQPFPVQGAVPQAYFRKLALTLDFDAMKAVIQ